MEGLSPLHRRVAGIDVHRMLHVVTVLIEEDDGSISKQQREFGGFKRDMKAMAAWLLELRVELVVMESTGIYWRSAHAHLERAGILALIVNAHFIKYVPGRKTDMGDSEWLAVLARFGLVRGSFIPPKDLRELRMVSRYRRKVSQMLSSETNRMHKVLDDAGIKPATSMVFYLLPKPGFLNFQFDKVTRPRFWRAYIDDQLDRCEMLAGARVFPVANANEFFAKSLQPSRRASLTNAQTL